jgi:hypothetical protein
MERHVDDEGELDESDNTPRGPAPAFEESDAPFLVEVTGFVINKEVGEGLLSSLFSSTRMSLSFVSSEKPFKSARIPFTSVRSSMMMSWSGVCSRVSSFMGFRGCRPAGNTSG